LTGGCLGIGREMIRIFTDLECKIINLDIREEEFREITKENKNVSNYKCDLSSRDDIDNFFKHRLKDVKIDILINNAAISFNKHFTDLHETMITKTTEINLIAPMLMCKKVIPLMQGSGHIVNIASVMSHTAASKSSLYIMSKWGLYGFHESLRYGNFVPKLLLDYFNSGINFTIICPFCVNTGMFPGFKSPIPL
jgi:short-subunit dehydrogenase